MQSMRSKPSLRSAAVLGFWVAVSAEASAQSLSFGVMPQRSATLTAQYWNPILNHVSARSGVALELKLDKSAPEHEAKVVRGDFDLAYTNHHLAPGNGAAGYRVFARRREAAVRSEIVVLERSPIRSLKELQGKDVGFPSRSAFVGYRVPMDTLVRAGVQVKPVFGGNGEGIGGQLRAGRVAAAGVNSQVMRDFAEREKFGYRVLWRSEEYGNTPLVAHPRVRREQVAAVHAALAAMAGDAQGSKILAQGAQLLALDPPFGFETANNRDYDSARRFMRTSVFKADEQ